MKHGVPRSRYQRFSTARRVGAQAQRIQQRQNHALDLAGDGVVDRRLAHHARGRKRRMQPDEDHRGRGALFHRRGDRAAPTVGRREHAEQNHIRLRLGDPRHGVRVVGQQSRQGPNLEHVVGHAEGIGVVDEPNRVPSRTEHVGQRLQVERLAHVVAAAVDEHDVHRWGRRSGMGGMNAGRRSQNGWLHFEIFLYQSSFPLSSP